MKIADYGIFFLILKWILGQSDFHRSLISHFLSQYDFVMMKTRHKEIRNQMKLVEIILT